MPKLIESFKKEKKEKKILLNAIVRRIFFFVEQVVHYDLSPNYYLLSVSIVIKARYCVFQM